MTMKLSIISGWTGAGEEEEAIIIPDKIAPFFFLSFFSLLIFISFGKNDV